MKKLGTRLMGIMAGGLLLLGIMISQGSCSDSMGGAPQAFGTLNRLVVIADQDLWDGHVGDTLRYYLGAAYPVLPQPEPIFDLQHFTAKEFKSDIYRKRFRNMLFISDVSSGNSPVSDIMKNEIGMDNVKAVRDKPEKANVKVSPNRWANKQQVIFLYGEGEQALIQSIKSKCAAIANVVKENEREMLNAQIYTNGRQAKVMELIKEKYGIVLPIPGEYILADEHENFMWVRKVSPNTVTNTNFLMYKEVYRDTSQLSPLGAKSLRDSLGRKYITSNIENSHMRVDDVNLPLFSELNPVDGRFALHQRGIWEMSSPRDMMAGPFMSYTIHNTETDEIIYIDAFAFAPGDPKRNIMQELEHVLSKTVFD